MKFSEYLDSFTWNGFEVYPLQFRDIYIKCRGEKYADDEIMSKFLRIDKFNASKFEPKEIIEKLPKGYSWRFFWLYADAINERL